MKGLVGASTLPGVLGLGGQIKEAPGEGTLTQAFKGESENGSDVRCDWGG